MKASESLQSLAERIQNLTPKEQELLDQRFVATSYEVAFKLNALLDNVLTVSSLGD